jgi:hypothetical protein
VTASLFGHPLWLLVLAWIGAAAVAGAVITLFFALGRRPQRYTTTETPPVDSRDFLLAVAGTVNAPLAHGGTARLLNNGVEIFPALLEAIREARQSINFMVYIWEPGRVSDAVMEALCERAGPGWCGSGVWRSARSPASTGATTAGPSWSTGASPSPAAPRWPTSGWATRSATATGAT